MKKAKDIIIESFESMYINGLISVRDYKPMLNSLELEEEEKGLLYYINVLHNLLIEYGYNN